MKGLRKFSTLWLALAGICRFGHVRFEGSRRAYRRGTHSIRYCYSASVCDESVSNESVKAALQLVCFRERLVTRNIGVHNVIISVLLEGSLGAMT